MHITKPLMVLLLIIGLSGCSVFSGSPTMSLSVSSDGRYVISAHKNQSLYLWDIQEKKRERIAFEQANLYSAFFIPNSNAFMWQNLNKEVIVQTVEGKELKRFKLDYHVYGHVMNLEQDVYVSADAEYIVRTIIQGVETQLKAAGGSFMGFGKVLNLNISEDASLLVTAGSGGPYDSTHDLIETQWAVGYRSLIGVNLWSLETLEPLAKLPGNSSKTHASISPDGQWVVSGDENGLGRYWNTQKPEQMFRMASYYHGIRLECDEEYSYNCPLDKSGLIPRQGMRVNPNTVAMGFIQNSRYYLRLSHVSGSSDDSHAVLFETGSPWPVKYFDLGTNPMPSVRDYDRNLTLSTAPEAGILVTGQHSRGGINVYQFDAQKLTLEKVWVGR